MAAANKGESPAAPPGSLPRLRARTPLGSGSVPLAAGVPTRVRGGSPCRGGGCAELPALPLQRGMGGNGSLLFCGCGPVPWVPLGSRSRCLPAGLGPGRALGAGR